MRDVTRDHVRDCLKDCELKDQVLHVKIKLFVTVRKVARGEMQLLYLLLVFVRTKIPVRTLQKYLQIIIS